MIIQFISEEDRIAAELIQKTTGGILNKGYIDPSALNDDIICIGGQYANSMYAAFMNLNVFDEITEGTPGTVFVRSYGDFNAYAAAGWDRSGTIAAAEWIFLNGLPASDTIAGDIGELTLISIPINSNQTVLDAVNNAVDDIRTNVTIAISSFFNVRYLNLSGTNLEILLQRENMNLSGWNWPVILGIIGGAIMIGIGIWIALPLLIGTGGLVVGATLIANIWTGIRSSAKEDMQEIIDYKLSKGYSLEDAKEEAEAYRPFDVGEIAKYAILAGGLGVGGYFLAKGLISKRGD